MSHYAVLVILPTKPTDDALEAALHPFDENDCFVDIDMTDEVNTDWLAPAKAVRLADGTVHNRYAERFYTGTEKDSLFPSITNKVFELPEGATEIELPRNETGEYRDIVAFATDYHGYEHRDGKFYRQSNPNAQWDWYQVGGRYSGKLRSLSGNAVKGRRGLAGSEADSDGVDIVQRSDLDLVTMRERRIKDRLKWLAGIREKSGLSVADLDKALLFEPTVDKAWKEHADPKPRGKEYGEWVEATFGEDGKRYNAARKDSWELPALGPHATADAWAKAAPAFSCWSVLHEGKWTEKGKMGWWGLSTGDVDQIEWEQRVTELVENLPGDHWLAVVDCHI